MFIKQIVLILDSNGDKSPYAKGFFEDESFIHTVIADNLLEGNELIEKYEPDLILANDNFNEDIIEICSEIRRKTSFYRPVILVLSGTDDIDKKIELLRAGADDFQNNSIDHKELSLRIFAHLRRHIEELTDPGTKLPCTSLSYRFLKRNISIEKNDKYALMYLDIDNFTHYREIYGHIAAEKLLQTFVAIIKTSLNENDFLGQVGYDNFIVFTSVEKAEKIAMFLSYSFDMVSPKFYTNDDINRGYLILDGDEKVGRRIPLVSVSIGIVSNQHNNFKSYEELLNSAMNVHRLAQSKTGSSWISDRPKLSGSESGKIPEKKILVIENDASLSYLLITTLEMQGYNVESINSSGQAIEMIQKISPDLIVFDISEDNCKKELEICRDIKENYSNVRVVVSTSDCKKEDVLDTGVDLYIPKPYELMVLFSWISRFLNYEVL